MSGLKLNQVKAKEYLLQDERIYSKRKIALRKTYGKHEGNMCNYGLRHKGKVWDDQNMKQGMIV